MATRKTIIEPSTNLKAVWKELWQYRDLYYFLSLRDILVRYKQTIIGVGWGVLRPLLTMIIFTLVFGKIAMLPSDGLPYPLFVFAAMIPWHFFANTLTDSSNSLVNNSQLISKVYFPRIIIPSTPMIVNLIDLLISLFLFLMLMAFYGNIPDIRVFAFPFFLILLLMISLGFGYIFSALNVTYRDFRYIVPFIIQLGLYISPVGFGSSIVPEKWKLLYALNPLTGIIDGFRWSFLGPKIQIYWPGLLISFIFSIGIFFFGVWFFNKSERCFADVI